MNCRSLQPQPCIFQISKRGQVIWQISCIGEENDNMFCLFWSICSQFSWWQSLWEDVQWNGDEFLLLPWFDAEWWPSLHCSLQITHLEMTICFNQATRLFIIISNAGPTIFEMDPQFLKNSSWTQGLRKKTVFEGVKHTESLPRNFCGLVIHIKNTFCKKIGSKRSFQPSAVVRTIYPPLYGVPAAN